MTDTIKTDGGCVTCKDIESRNWYAWLNLMPPRPNTFHVTGEVFVPNPGVNPVLTPRVPQGINPEILLMELQLLQQSGVWPQVFVWKQARYDLVRPFINYTLVQVFCQDKIIAKIKVEEVH